MSNFSQEFTLDTLNEGKLKEDFDKAYLEVLQSIPRGSVAKASITIKIDFSRMGDTDTLVNVEHVLVKRLPTFKKKGLACVVTKDGKPALKVSEPEEPSENISMFQAK
ncbi:MAG: hypothetical protein HGB11_13485 [Chlorobiales bacterium]|nr:hypothetical protein [Chlorobiales bacterium]